MIGHLNDPFDKEVEEMKSNIISPVTNQAIKLRAGAVLTIDHDTITSSGQLGFKKGEKVTVREVWKTEEKWSNIYNVWLDEVIHGVKLENHYGIYFLSLFEETKNIATK
jgi:hypothetical protein